MRFTGNSWNVGEYHFTEHQWDSHGVEPRLVYGYSIGQLDTDPHQLYDSIESAMAEAIAEKLTGTKAMGHAPGVGSAAAWFLTMCHGAKAQADN